MITQLRLKMIAALVELTHGLAVAIENRNAESRAAAFLHTLSVRLADGVRANTSF